MPLEYHGILNLLAQKSQAHGRTLCAMRQLYLSILSGPTHISSSTNPNSPVPTPPFANSRASLVQTNLLRYVCLEKT
ncbi:hypothetical protein PILCRDRAFT_494147 [Piloderma croceum F 1598]|uniref:Uncharacterized protein n=1 Tax=Piloderma croceum (strain F 1598) TaxID=765440 RepID=A0A0C3BX00_PILCF|nr:hypothetical protein PILCRDRAFT_494147 [Piloderma croceum F 1598]